MRFMYLHGFASSPMSRKAQLFHRLLAAEGIPLELPALDQGDFSRLTLSSQLRLIESELSSAPAVLIGSSMGGYLAALYAARHPEVQRLVLLAPAFGFATRWPHITGSKPFQSWRETGWMNVFHYGDQTARPIHYGLYEDALRYPEEPDFHQPARIFHGTNDPVVPVQMSERFVATHANATLTTFPSGHELTDVLDRIAAEAMPFLLDGTSGASLSA